MHLARFILAATFAGLPALGAAAQLLVLNKSRRPHGQDGTHMVLASRDGKRFFTSNIGSNTVSILEPAADGQWKQRVVKVGLDLGAGNLLVLDAHQYTEVKRLRLGSSPAGILVAPDGATAYVAVTGSNQIAVIDLKTLSVAKTFEPGHEPDGMAWVR